MNGSARRMLLVAQSFPASVVETILGVDSVVSHRLSRPASAGGGGKVFEEFRVGRGRGLVFGADLGPLAGRPQAILPLVDSLVRASLALPTESVVTSWGPVMVSVPHQQAGDTYFSIAPDGAEARWDPKSTGPDRRTGGHPHSASIGLAPRRGHPLERGSAIARYER